jgi:dihydroxy-acid dehydratase
MTAPRLRSQHWFGGADLNGFLHRAWIKAEGFSEDAVQGRPVIGVANSWSEATNCNAHLRILPARRPRPELDAVRADEPLRTSPVGTPGPTGG